MINIKGMTMEKEVFALLYGREFGRVMMDNYNEWLGNTEETDDHMENVGGTYIPDQFAMFLKERNMDDMDNTMYAATFKEVYGDERFTDMLQEVGGVFPVEVAGNMLHAAQVSVQNKPEGMRRFVDCLSSMERVLLRGALS